MMEQIRGFNFESNMAEDIEFVKTINKLVKDYSIEEIIESGTAYGTGSTLVFAKTGLPVKTLECNKYLFDLAKQNLAKFSNVEAFHGFSLKKSDMMHFVNSSFALKTRIRSESKELYLKELSGSAPENLLPKLLNKNKRQLVFLDSCGGVGELEYNLVRKFKPTLLVLDDIDHIKHNATVKDLIKRGCLVKIFNKRAWTDFSKFDSTSELKILETYANETFGKLWG